MTKVKAKKKTKPVTMTGLKRQLKETTASRDKHQKRADMEDLVKRPDDLGGSTYKLKWPEKEAAIYITINDTPDEKTGEPRPYEIFINSKNVEHYAWTTALTLMISAVFRRGGKVAFIAEELQSVFDPNGGAWLDGRYVPSVLAAIGGIIEQHMIGIGYIRQVEPPDVPDVPEPSPGGYEAGVIKATEAVDKANDPFTDLTPDPPKEDDQDIPPPEG